MTCLALIELNDNAPNNNNKASSVYKVFFNLKTFHSFVEFGCLFRSTVLDLHEEGVQCCALLACEPGTASPLAVSIYLFLHIHVCRVKYLDFHRKFEICFICIGWFLSINTHCLCILGCYIILLGSVQLVACARFD